MTHAANDDMAEGFGTPGYFEAIEAEFGQAVTSFPMEDCDTIHGHSAPWLLKGVIPLTGVFFIVGASTAGKSFASVDLASHIARGEPFLGKRTLKSGGIYVAAEGADGVRRRFEGARTRTGGWDGLLHMTPRAPDLTKAADVEGLLADAKVLQARLEARGERLGFILIDTLSASLAGADENSGADMATVMRSLQRLAEELGVCVMVVAHLGKEAHRGLRGWSGLKANADGEMIIESADEDGTRILTVTKVKDGEAGQKFAFGLEVIELGHDGDGDPITTCLVDWSRSLPTKTAKSSLTPDRQIILTALDRLIDANLAHPIVINETIGVGARPGTRGVKSEDLRDQAYELGLGGVVPNEPHAKKLWIDRRRKSFANNFGFLVSEKFIRHEGDLVWPIPKPRDA